MQNNNEQVKNGVSSVATSSNLSPDVSYKDIFYQLEQAIGADVQNVKNLVAQNVITKQQGQYLLAQLGQKAQSINTYRNAQAANLKQTAQLPKEMPQNPMDVFNKEHPGFFEANGRGAVLEYIKDLGMDKDEILRIAQLVEGLENSAVDKYLKKSAYEKSLNDENVLAKSKLTSYAQNSSSDKNTNRIFTREEIGNMSGEEFTKNEKSIMEQLKQGLIK